MAQEDENSVIEEEIKSEAAPKKTRKKKKTVSKRTTVKAKVREEEKEAKVKEEEKTSFHLFAEKTAKIFDSFIDEIKEIPKKTSEFSKQSHVVDTLSKLIQKAKDEFRQKKDEFTEIHHLNSAIASDKRKYEQKIIQLGTKAFQFLEQKKIECRDLEPLEKELSLIQKEINEKEAKLKKILDRQ